MQNNLSISLNGTTELPPGKIATIVTSLEMRTPPERLATMERSGRLGLERLTGKEMPRYLALYRELGWRWMWFSRLVMPEAELAAILDDPAVEAYAVSQNGQDIGLLELDRRVTGEVEIAFFGLLEGAVGQGIGAGLMAQALELAWSPPAKSAKSTAPMSRVWVHTCTFDHPSAVRFYQRCGFSIYQLGVEVADDPRLAGHLPMDAAPHVPLLR